MEAKPFVVPFYREDLSPVDVLMMMMMMYLIKLIIL